MVNQNKSTQESELERIKRLRYEGIKKAKVEKIGDIKELPVVLSKLTDKQKAYVEARAGGMLKKQAGRLASPDCKQPTMVAARLEKDPLVQQALALAFEDAGVTVQALAHTFKRGMGAKKTYSHKVSGRLVESIHDDHKVQVDSAKAVVDILGLRVPKEDQGSKHLHIHINQEEMDEMEDGVLAHLQSKFGRKV